MKEGENNKRNVFIHSMYHPQSSIEQSRVEQKKKKKKDQQIRRCRDRRKLGQVCSVPADARDSPAFL